MPLAGVPIPQWESIQLIKLQYTISRISEKISLLELNPKRNHDETREINMLVLQGLEVLSDLDLALEHTGMNFREISSKYCVLSLPSSVREAVQDSG